MKGPFRTESAQHTGASWSDSDLDLLQKLLTARAHLKDGDRAGAIRAVESAIETLKKRVDHG